MASIWRDARSNNFLIKFHFAGKRFLRSCKTTKENEALRIKASTEETTALLGTGRLRLPDDVTDPAFWIMSGGKFNGKPVVEVSKWQLLGEVCDAYLDSQLHKAGTTLVGERVHIRHLKRILGVRIRIDGLNLDQMQGYIVARLKESNGSGKLVTGTTVKKELLTFTQIWDWAHQRNIVRRNCPIKDPIRRRWLVSIPLPAESEKFMPWSESEHRVERLLKDDPDQKHLWRFLFLDETQRDALLEHVRKSAACPFVHPMFALAAFAGARRSEICRSLVEDFRFDDNLVVIREKKRRKDRSDSTREVPMHPQLREIMTAWKGEHPGGRFMFVVSSKAHGKTNQTVAQLTPGDAHRHFKAALADSKWGVIPGFHVLRHSFGAICARNAIPMSMTGKWMGHTSEEMMAHYQHLFPDDEQKWMKNIP